jgi:hypothetical protein
LLVYLAPVLGFELYQVLIACFVSRFSNKKRRRTFIFQNPQNKREVFCDETLKPVLGGKDKVGFLEIAKLLSEHFPKAPKDPKTPKSPKTLKERKVPKEPKSPKSPRTRKTPAAPAV